MTTLPSITTTVRKKRTLSTSSWRPAHAIDSFVALPSGHSPSQTGVVLAELWEPASRRRAMAKGQVQRRYLDRAESTSLRAMLPPVILAGRTRYLSTRPAVQALLSCAGCGVENRFGERRVCGRLPQSAAEASRTGSASRTLLLNWSLRGQGPAPAGMPHQACLVKKRERGIRKAIDAISCEAHPSLAYTPGPPLCVGIVP